MKQTVWKLMVLQVGLCFLSLGCDDDRADANRSDDCLIGSEGCSCFTDRTCSTDLTCNNNVCVRLEGNIDTDTMPIENDKDTIDIKPTVDSGSLPDGKTGTGTKTETDTGTDTNIKADAGTKNDAGTVTDVDSGTDSGTDAEINTDADTTNSGQSNGTIKFTYQPKDERIPMLVFAIWMENDAGEYLATMSIGDFIGSRGGGNRGIPDLDSGGNGDRVSSLPIWIHRRNVIDTTFGYESLYPPPASSPSYPADIDAVTSATPVGGVTQTTTYELTDLPYGKYNFYMEANHSFDQNADHDYSFYRGQPSVLWTVSVTIGDSADSTSVLDYAGYGSPDGTDGDIRPPDSTITTAADLIEDLGGYKFKVEYTP